jgi:hypothetical protein
MISKRGLGPESTEKGLLTDDAARDRPCPASGVRLVAGSHCSASRPCQVSRGSRERVGRKRCASYRDPRFVMTGWKDQGKTWHADAEIAQADHGAEEAGRPRALCPVGASHAIMRSAARQSRSSNSLPSRRGNAAAGVDGLLGCSIGGLWQGSWTPQI